MSVSEPANSFPVSGVGGSRMKLPLHSAGDHNGNAFPISSSSSSSSSSSCLGESSPESLRSLSSLSEGRTDSPLDYNMFDVTLTTVKTVTLKSVVSDWTPEEERNPDDGDDGDDGDDASLGKSQTVAESTDNSVSVYLDANGDDCQQDSWNDNLTLALSLTGNGGLINEDLSSGSSNGRRRSSATPDSDATEVPDDDDDEEEALFVSVSSDVDVQRSSTTITSSGSRSGVGIVTSGVNAELEEVEVDGPAVHCPPSTGRHTDPPASEDLSEDTQMPTEDVKKTSSPPPEEAETGVEGSKPPPSQPDVSLAARPRPAPRSAVSTAAKPPGPEAKRVSRVDLKTVKAKVGSRPAPSPPKPATQVHGSQVLLCSLHLHPEVQGHSEMFYVIGNK